MLGLTYLRAFTVIYLVAASRLLTRHGAESLRWGRDGAEMPRRYTVIVCSGADRADDSPTVFLTPQTQEKQLEFGRRYMLGNFVMQI